MKRLKAQSQGLAVKLRYLGIDPAQVSGGKLFATIGIVAPISGYITQLNINQERFVQPEEMLYEIVNNQHIHLELDVFESNIAQVAEGMHISFTIPSVGTEMFAGEVRLVGRSFNMESKTVRVHGHIEGKHPNFIRGSYVEAKIWNDAATVKALPTELVATGLFSISRNPIFLGIILADIGLFLVAPNAFTLLIDVLSIVVIQTQVRLEEAYLTTKHGDSYLSYKQKVARWL